MTKTKRHYIKPHTEAWFQFRMENGYGASETASVLASYSEELNQWVWTPPIKTHLLKIGEPIQQFTGNESSLAGQAMEARIVEYYRCFDKSIPDDVEASKDMYANFNGARKFFRKVMQPKCYITNSNYPWLFFSPDGLEYDKGKLVATVECKNTTGMEQNRYPDKISPSFVVQIQTGLLVTGLEVANIAILIDGARFRTYEFEADYGLHETILEKTHEAWRNVIQARIIKEEYGVDRYFGINIDRFHGREREGVLMLQDLEPSFYGTDKELEFLKENVKASPEFAEMKATDGHVDMIAGFLKFDAEAKTAEARAKELKAKLIYALGDYHMASYDSKAYYSYKPDTNGIRKFYVSPEMKKLCSQLS